MTYSCIVYIFAVYLLLGHAFCTLYETKTAVTVTLAALTTWMMQGVAEKWFTVLNHSNGPFQDQHLFKKDDLIMSNVGSCHLSPYQINPVQNIYSLP